MQENNSVRAKKHLGQHFLTDLNIARKIAGSVMGGTPDNPASVLEVGCGMGILTRFLLEKDDLKVYGAEIDSESVDYLRLHYPDFTERLYPEDFLQMALRQKFSPCGSLSIV
ncbi:MAG: hypothetical protein LUE10_07660, partial [Alistipes sp.]|nr:hypothetical protein [Alistipes sp.]